MSFQKKHGCLSFTCCMKNSLLLSSLIISLLPGTLLMADTNVPGSLFSQKSGPGFETVDPAKVEVRKEADFLKSLKEGVQVTELGCMRAVFVFDESAADFETQVTEAFSDADFRVFSKSHIVTGSVQPKALLQIGVERTADLVIYTTLASREKPQLGKLHLHEAICTMRVYSPTSEELLVSETARIDGQRHVDPVIAARSATEGAVTAATKELILKTLEKAHKILVHEAQIKGIRDHNHLLKVMEYTARLKGVYHVRQLTFDKETRLAVIEIIAAPQTETFWRAYVENFPKYEDAQWQKENIKLLPNQELRRKNPDWLSGAN